MSKYDIDIEKIYRMPQNISVVSFEDRILVISPFTANWIVLQSSRQLNIFNYLASGNSIKSALCNPSYDNNDVTYVVTQIEARRFYNKNVHQATDDGRAMHLYLTNNCNLQCPHCYMNSGIKNKDELSTEEVVKLIVDYKTIAHGTRITLSGGEPSTHTDFDFIVKKAATLGLEVKILTNGALMTTERISALAPFLHSVQISIDGFSEESNAVIRGIGHFDKALNAVDACVTNGIETSIAITPSLELLQSHTSDYADFAKDLIAKYKGKPFEVKFAEGLSPGRKINPSQETNDKYAALIKNIQKAIYGEQYDLITFVEKINSDVIINNCMFGVFTVSSTGDVYFCPEIGSLSPVANIRSTPFLDIYNKSKIAENATCISNLQPCNQCELMYICGGGCRIKEFPSLVQQASFENIDYPTIHRRACPSSLKERFYRMMLDGNEYLYKPLGE